MFSSIEVIFRFVYYCLFYLQISSRMQRWDEMHDSVLSGSVLHPDDVAVMNDTHV